MYVNMVIYKPVSGYEQDLISSMHRYGAAAEAAEGLESVHTLRAESGELVGIAVWHSEAAAEAANASIMAAVEGDNFDLWVDGGTGYRLETA